MPSVLAAALTGTRSSTHIALSASAQWDRNKPWRGSSLAVRNEVSGLESSDDIICEVMVHPGDVTPADQGGCGGGPDVFAQSSDREHETDTLFVYAAQGRSRKGGMETSVMERTLKN